MNDRSLRYDVLVAGEINPDLILSGNVEPAFGQVEQLVDSANLTIGSSSAIFACGAARLGLKVAFIGKCGDDLFGRFMLDAMRARGVDVDPVIVVQGGATGMCVILNRGVDRAILTSMGLISALAAGEIPDDLLRQARHLHVASFFLQTALQPGLPGLFRRAQALGLTTSLDTNYDPDEQWRGFDELLAATDVFLPNETEACSLTGAVTVEQAAVELSARVNTVAIKLGARGALGVSRGERIESPSIPVEVVDTVGAGDSFDAGFIYGYLHGWPSVKTLRLAAVCGALSTRAAGGTSTQATLAEALPYLDG
jgi:sugar/nucleoside kinase (ribokinase family)